MTTKIRWTETHNADGTVTPGATWNPTTGCSHVSPGCDHCYAETISLRFKRSLKPWKAQFAAENVKLHPERLEQPLHWTKPRRVFVDSMSDLFHELIPFEFLDQVFSVMERCPQHTFQILTKRPARMRHYVTDRWQRKISWLGPETAPAPWIGHGYLPSNIWLGTSVEDQRRANERIPILLETPAAVRFLSMEPLLGPVELKAEWFYNRCAGGCGCIWPEDADVHDCGCDGGCCEDWWSEREPKLHWIIVGGESGPGYRPMDPEWAGDIRDQCVGAAVPFFFKQSSGPRTEMGQELDGQRWEQWPA